MNRNGIGVVLDILAQSVYNGLCSPFNGSFNGSFHRECHQNVPRWSPTRCATESLSIFVISRICESTSTPSPIPSGSSGSDGNTTSIIWSGKSIAVGFVNLIDEKAEDFPFLVVERDWTPCGAAAEGLGVPIEYEPVDSEDPAVLAAVLGPCSNVIIGSGIIGTE